MIAPDFCCASYIPMGSEPLQLSEKFSPVTAHIGTWCYDGLTIYLYNRMTGA